MNHDECRAPRARFCDGKRTSAPAHDLAPQQIQRAPVPRVQELGREIQLSAAARFRLRFAGSRALIRLHQGGAN
jgi:hypothetical protein